MNQGAFSHPYPLLYDMYTTVTDIVKSGVTFIWGGGGGWLGGQVDGIAMIFFCPIKVKFGANGGGPLCEWRAMIPPSSVP